MWHPLNYTSDMLQKVMIINDKMYKILSHFRHVRKFEDSTRCCRYFRTLSVGVLLWFPYNVTLVDAKV